MGTTTLEQFRAEFATEAGRRRLGYRAGDPWSGKVERVLADDDELRGEFASWQQRQQRRVAASRATVARARRSTHGRLGVALLLAGLALGVTAANLVADHTKVVSDGPCRQVPHLYSDRTTTKCPAHSEPIYDTYRTVWSVLGWGVGGGMTVTGVVLIVRHPRF